MAQNITYEEEDYEEGITFAKIGHFIKKGWMRMVIYMVVLVLVATAIALPIRTYSKSAPVAQTSIEFIYKGIEKGETPDGSLLNSDDIIAPAILAAAVDDAGLGDKVTDISSFRQAVRVESVETNEYVQLVAAAADGNTDAANTLRNYTMYPTRFNIVISNPEGYGLSDEQAKLLLDKIVMAYYKDFQKRYSVVNMFDSEMFVLSRNELLEFTDIYDMYVSSLTSIKSYLTTLASENPTFTSHKNNTTFNQLVSDLSLLSSNFDLFNAFIIAKNVWRNADTAKNTLEASKKTVTNNLAATEKYIQSLKAQIEAIKNELQLGVEAPSGGQILVNYPSYPAVYDTLNTRLEETTRQVLDYNIQLANIETRLEQITVNSETITSEEDKAAAAQSISTLETQASALVAKINSTIEDYYDTTFISSSVRQVQAPVVTRRGSNLSLTLVYLIALIAGFIAASIVTLVKMSRAKVAAKQAAAQETKQSNDEKTEAAENTQENK